MTQRNAIFDWLRHSLALMVIVSHCTPVLRGDNTTEPLMQLTNGRITFGTLAVYGFFLLSGHLITISWRRDPHILRYARRRAQRILPAWMAAIIFGTLLAAFFGQYAQNPLAGDRNAPLWTLGFEVVCYILIVLTRGHGALIALLGAGFYLAGFHGVVPIMFLAFGIGSMIPRFPPIAVPSIGVDWSYGLYVYAFPIQQALAATLGVQMHPLVLAVLTLAITLPLCALSWHYLEAPLLRNKTATMP
jgi:peptidoglycan/LPS O-acetylase OafA/YrhL